MTSSMHQSGLPFLTDETYGRLSASTATISGAVEGKETLYGKTMTVLSGYFQPSQYESVFVPNYQRDVLLGTRTKQAELIEAMTSSQGIPDGIILCLRSTSVEVTAGQLNGARDFRLTGPLALLDGLQRIAAALKAKQKGLGDQLRSLKVIVYIDTDEQLERKIFDQFNHGHTQVGSQVRMRNYLVTSPAASAIWALVDPTKTRTPVELARAQKFPLFGRVQCDQNKGPNDLITLKMMLEMATAVHGCAEKSVPETIDDISILAVEYGQKTFVRNVETFFRFANECFPFEGEGSRPQHTRRHLLRALALLLAHHEDFWNSRNTLLLEIPAPIKRKLAGIDWTFIEKELRGGQQVPTHLENLFVRRLNAGKRSRAAQLQPRQL